MSDISLCCGSINMFTLAVRDLHWMMCNFPSLASISELSCFIPEPPLGIWWWKRRNKLSCAKRDFSEEPGINIRTDKEGRVIWKASRTGYAWGIVPWPHINYSTEARWFRFTSALWSDSRDMMELSLFNIFISDFFNLSPFLPSHQLPFLLTSGSTWGCQEDEHRGTMEESCDFVCGWVGVFGCVRTSDLAAQFRIASYIWCFWIGVGVYSRMHLIPIKTNMSKTWQQWCCICMCTRSEHILSTFTLWLNQCPLSDPNQGRQLTLLSLRLWQFSQFFLLLCQTS